MTQKKKLNIIAVWIAFFVMLSRMMLYLSGMPLVHYTMLAAKWCIFPFAVAMALRTPGKPTLIDGLVALYGAAIVLSSYMGGGVLSVYSVLMTAMDIFIVWALIRWFFRRGSDYPLYVITIILTLFAVVNLVLIFLFPEGLWKYIDGKAYYLLGGNYNNMGRALHIALATNLIYFLRSGKLRLNLLFLFLCSFATVLRMGSMTSAVGLALLAGFAFLPSRSLKLIASTLFITIYFVFQSWAVFTSKENRSKEAEFFVEHVLHKDMTFTKRSFVWEKSTMLIRQKPVWGYGQQDARWHKNKLGVLTTHNLILGILLKGGWVALSIFLLMMLAVQFRALFHPCPGMFIAWIALWIFLFMMIMEVYTFQSIALLIMYINYLPILQRYSTIRHE